MRKQIEHFRTKCISFDSAAAHHGAKFAQEDVGHQNQQKIVPISFTDNIFSSKERSFCIVLHTGVFTKNVALQSKTWRKIGKFYAHQLVKMLKEQTHRGVNRAHYDGLLRNSAKTKSQFVKMGAKHGTTEFL